MPAVLAEHLLQEHDIGVGAADRLAQFVQHETAVELVEALVDVEAQHPQQRLGQAGGLGFDVAKRCCG